jgi:phage-related minor tail protein
MPKPTIDTTAAAASLTALADGPARDAAEAIGDAFAVAGKKMSSALEAAARTGEFSVSRLARSILKDLSSIAFDRFVTTPLSNALANIPRLPLSGARASGGPVQAGGAYLVGERGPEVFVPYQSGAIADGMGVGAGPVHVTINMPAGSSLNDARRSSAQIATALARAVQRGARGL